MSKAHVRGPFETICTRERQIHGPRLCSGDRNCWPADERKFINGDRPYNAALVESNEKSSGGGISARYPEIMHRARNRVRLAS